MSRALILLFLPAVAHAAASFDWFRQIGAGQDSSLGLATDARGNIYAAGTTRSANFPAKSPLQPCTASAAAADIFIVKLDPSGNILYSTCFGGGGEDVAYAFTVDATGSVYLTGLTYSADFPVTRDAYRASPPPVPPQGTKGWSFVSKLSADGTLAYSTFFTTSLNRPAGIAVDTTGSVYLSGISSGDLPVMPGVYQPVCGCGVSSNGFFSVVSVDSFLARLDPAGANVVFATYLGFNVLAGGTTQSTPIAVAPDGSVFLGSSAGVYHFNSSGTALLAKASPGLAVQALAPTSDGSLYAAGLASTNFQPTAAAVQTSPNTFPALSYQPRIDQQTAIAKFDASLVVQAATYFGGPYFTAIHSLAVEAAGNLLVAGDTAPHGLPTRSPIYQGFGFQSTGFAAVLASDLSALHFSSYFGDNETFSFKTVAAGDGHSFLLAGMTFNPAVSPASGSVWLNKVRWSPPETLRIDSVVNAASHIDDPLSGGETIVVQGEGFAAGSRLAIGDFEVIPLAVTAREITAVLPSGLSGASAIQVRSSSAISNTVVAPNGVAAPGLFSIDGTGRGQGLILNDDGQRNAPDHAARPGEKITIFATGVGPVNFDRGYAVTANPVSVYIDGLYCRGVAAMMGPVEGLPGDVYQLTVFVPTYEELVAYNADLRTYRFPPQAGIVLRLAGGASQNGLAISIQP